MTENEIREAVMAFSGNRENILYSPQQWKDFSDKLLALAKVWLYLRKEKLL